MKNHLQKEHLVVVNDDDDDYADNSVGEEATQFEPQQKFQTVNNLLVRFLVGENLPISLVESKKLKEFAAGLNKNYCPPTR